MLCSCREDKIGGGSSVAEAFARQQSAAAQLARYNKEPKQRQDCWALIPLKSSSDTNTYLLQQSATQGEAVVARVADQELAALALEARRV